MNTITKALIVFFCFASLQSIAQSDAPIYDFYGSVTKAVGPQYKPVSMMIKIDVDAANKVTGIELSDSASPELKKQFDANRQKLNIKALDNYTYHNGVKNITLLIPYYVTNENDKAKQAKDPLLNTFNGRKIKGKTKVLEPIHGKYSITTTTTTTTITKS